MTAEATTPFHPSSAAVSNMIWAFDHSEACAECGHHAGEVAECPCCLYLVDVLGLRDPATGIIDWTVR
jgi:hypothetical protein